MIENLSDISPSRDFFQDAKQAGIAEKTLRRAIKDFGVKSKKSDGKWYLMPSEKIKQMRHVLCGENYDEKQDDQDDQDGQLGHPGEFDHLGIKKRIFSHEKAKKS